MQDLHSIPGGAPARFFPTGLGRADAGSFVDRRLRPSPHQNLKCPRCDSPNTKFCYYNNYNLSQPRHFCKSCRRYWTKGGVLRNVPVGGGCRKSSSKRSSNSASTPSSKSSSKSVNSSRSTVTCDNGSLLTPTATTSSTTTTPIGTTPVDQPPPAPAEIFSASTRATDLVSTAGYCFPDFYSFQITQPQQYETQIKVDGNDHVPTPTVDDMPLPPPGDHLGFMDQMVPADLHTLLDRGTESSDYLTTVDWQGCLDATVGLFDSVVGATGVGDQGLFWSHGRWGDVEPTPFFP